MLVNQRPHGSHPQKLIKCIKKPSKTPQTSKSSKYYYQDEKLIFLALFYKTFRVCIGWLSVEKGQPANSWRYHLERSNPIWLSGLRTGYFPVTSHTCCCSNSFQSNVDQTLIIHSLAGVIIKLQNVVSQFIWYSFVFYRQTGIA